MNKALLEKTELFVNVALSKIASLETEVSQKKAEQVYQRNFNKKAITKIQDQLYEQDFLTDKYAYDQFVQESSKDILKLQEVVSSIINSKDVLSFGKAPDADTFSKTQGTEDWREEFFRQDPLYQRMMSTQNNLTNFY